MTRYRICRPGEIAITPSDKSNKTEAMQVAMAFSMRVVNEAYTLDPIMQQTAYVWADSENGSPPVLVATFYQGREINKNKE